MTKPKKKIRYKGKSLTVYGIGWFSILVNRTTTQIRRWEKAGVLPLPLLDIEGDRRWYTAGELHGYSRIFKNSNVRTGMKIENTPFKIKAAEFRMRYKRVLEGSAEEIEAALPEEAEIEKAFSEDHETKVRNEARAIADGLLN